MPGPTTTDLRAVLAYAESTLAVTDVDGVRSALLPGLAGLIGGHAATLHETDLRAPRHYRDAYGVRVAPERVVGVQSGPRPGGVPFAGTEAAARTPSLLSGREQQVLRLVAEGLTDAQVARRLGLSPRTVSKHLERTYARLGVPNRAAAVTRWAELGVDNSP